MTSEKEPPLTHFDASGRPHMVDVSAKDETTRTAVAEGFVRMTAETLAIVRSRSAQKGDAAAIAELAGITGAKKTSDLIPLCHPLPLTQVAVETEVDHDAGGVRVTATVKTSGRTGVEMEALTAVSVACLTLYDMLKARDRTMTIDGVALLEKTGGASGDYVRKTKS